MLAIMSEPEHRETLRIDGAILDERERFFRKST